MSRAASEAEPDPRVVQLGLRLRRARLQAGYSLRELARQLHVSPSFVSQIEHGKSQPSVATLYQLARLLEVSVDRLFEEYGDQGSETDGGTTRESDEQDVSPGGDHVSLPISRIGLGSPTRVWQPHGSTGRVSVTAPGQRTRLVMDTGVVWEQLVLNTDHTAEFMEIIYPAGSSSTTDDRMLRHEGFEYGYLLEGELEITVGFDTFTLRAGESVGLDSSMPHLFRNRGVSPARGIWFVHHAS